MYLQIKECPKQLPEVHLKEMKILMRGCTKVLFVLIYFCFLYFK
jgi:hypothetical protein